MRKPVSALFAGALLVAIPAPISFVAAQTTTTIPAVELIDINSASKAELMTLPGIGEARSNAILKGRPYRGKDELVSKKIVPDNLYETIKDKIVARQK